MRPLDLDPAAWARLDRLLDAALDLPAGERAAWLAALGPEAEPLEPRLRELLARAAAIEGAGFLTALPVLEGAPAAEGADVAARPGSRFGPYRLVRLLADGGMGSVWLAERADGTMRRPVALKLPRGAWAGGDLAGRLEREREILAALDHPHIACIHDAGVSGDGQPWLALEYVAGLHLDAYAREARLDTRARVRLSLQVAAAVGHAHGRLVVHRDLKPSNIMVTGEGQVRLVDFGIAKLLEEGEAGDSDLTRLGGRALTPAYAAPEQVRGEPLGVAADLFSLGVVLYELLTSRLPFGGAEASARQREQAVLHHEPPRPSAVAAEPAARRALAGDLDQVLLKALQKRPEDRYQTAQAFADDLRRWLEGRPVQAQPDRLGYRLRKFVGRHRPAVAAALAVVALVLGGAGAALWQGRRAVAERRRAEEAKELVVSLLRSADPYEAGRTMSASDLLKALRARIDRDLGGRPELRVELLTILGGRLVHLQELAAADEVLASAEQEGRRVLGATRPTTLRARLEHANVHRLRGRIDALEQELRELVPALRAAGGPLRPELAQAMRMRASVALARGRVEEGVTAAREALDFAMGAFGPANLHACEAAVVLTLAQVSARQPAAALADGERALRLATETFRGQLAHPQVIQARLAHGLAVGLAEDPRRAADLLEETVRDARRVFGEDSTVMAYALPRLVSQQILAGEVDAAVENGAAAVRAGARRAEPGTHVMANLLTARGAALLAARRPDEAVPDLAEVVDIGERVAGPSSARARSARVELALALAHAGERERAQQALAPALAGGEPTPEARLVQGMLARLAGDPEEALRIHQVLPPAPSAAPGPRRLRMRALQEIGLDELARGHPSAAEAPLAEALALHRALERQVTPDHADALLALGRARLAARRAAAALEPLRAADAAWRKLAPGSRWAGEAGQWLARARAAAPARQRAPARPAGGPAVARQP